MTGFDAALTGRNISAERPFGATVVVSAGAGPQRRYLLLHRVNRGAGWQGDWTWTPPGGGRLPGEDVAVTAARELREETGLQAEPVPVMAGDVDCAVFRLEVPSNTAVVLDGVEHDRFEWVTFDEACRRYLPVVVADGLRAAHADMDGLDVVHCEGRAGKSIRDERLLVGPYRWIGKYLLAYQSAGWFCSRRPQPSTSPLGTIATGYGAVALKLPSPRTSATSTYRPS